MSSDFFLLAQQLESSYGRVWSEMPGIRYHETTVPKAVKEWQAKACPTKTA
jgi:hypothetical protein